MPRLSTVVVFAAALALFCLRLGAAALWDNDETIYTQIAREMIRTGDWVTLQWRGQPWFVHPPLHFWLVALFSSVLGMTEVAARLPAALFGAGCVALVEVWGRTMFSPRAGWLAAAALALNFQFFVESRMANMDTTILFFVTLALYGFWRACQGHRGGWYLMFVASGLACLSKGPLGLVLPWMVAVPFLASVRQLSRLKEVPWIRGGALAVVTGLSWYGLEVVRHGGAFSESVFVFYTWNRLTTRVMNQGGPVWLYLPIVLIGMFPWSLLLPQALAGLWRQGGRLIVLSVLVPFLFFSAAVTKLPNYILFVAPGAALAAGWYLDRALAEPPARLRLALVTAALVASFALAVIPLRVAPAFSEYSRDTWRLAEALVAVVTIGAVAALAALYRRSSATAVAILTAAMAAFLIGCAVFLVPEIERYRPIKPLGLAARRALHPGDRLAIHAVPGEHGLEFYADASVRVIGDEGDLKATIEATPGLLVVVPARVYDRLAVDGEVIAIAAAADAVLAASRRR